MSVSKNDPSEGCSRGNEMHLDATISTADTWAMNVTPETLPSDAGRLGASGRRTARTTRQAGPNGLGRGDVEIGDPPGLKILSESHWAFVEEGSGDQGPTSGGGGTYTVEGSTYTERVDYHGATSFVGEDIAFAELHTQNCA